MPNGGFDALRARRDALARAHLINPITEADVAWLHAWLQQRNGSINHRAARVIAWLIEEHVRNRIVDPDAPPR